MLRISTIIPPALGTFICVVAQVACSALHAAAPPSYELRSLGAGSPVSVNNQGTVVGLRTLNPSTNHNEALVSTAGQPWVNLPAPAGAVSVFPTDLNDSGVIVGVANLSSGRRAIRWTPSAAGYTVEVLPDHRVIATVGRNSNTGQSSAVLLTPSGTVSPPPAPTNLLAVSHTATRMEPFHSINLTWENSSTLASTYELERRTAGDTTWTRLHLTGTGITALQSWATTAGLPHGKDGPADFPQNDAVSNLEKFAFNLNPMATDCRRLTVGANEKAGLPGAAMAGGRLRLEFIRRKATTHPGITYTPQFASDIGAWRDVTGTLAATSIDSTWERVVVDDPATTAGAACFARLEVVAIP